MDDPIVKELHRIVSEVKGGLVSVKSSSANGGGKDDEVVGP